MRDKYLDLAWELKKNKLWNIKVMLMQIVIGTLDTVSKGGLGNKRTSGKYSMIEIGQKNKESLRDLRRLAVTWTLVENHRLTLVGNLENE